MVQMKIISRRMMKAGSRHFLNEFKKRGKLEDKTEKESSTASKA